MDKNIAALLREDCVTVDCVFHADEALEEHVEQNLVFPAGAHPNAVIEAKRAIKEGKSPAFALRPGATKYTYVAPTAMKLAAGDNVVVETKQGVRVVKVIKVDDKVRIDPNSDIEYKWVVSKVDMVTYKAELAKNAAIESAVAEAYTKRMRRSFRDTVLGELDEADRARVLEYTMKPATA